MKDQVVRDALRQAESALAVRASLRDGEQRRNQAALEAVRAVLFDTRRVVRRVKERV